MNATKQNTQYHGNSKGKFQQIIRCHCGIVLSLSLMLVLGVAPKASNASTLGQHFYERPPSQSAGTMSYMQRRYTWPGRSTTGIVGFDYQVRIGRCGDRGSLAVYLDGALKSRITGCDTGHKTLDVSIPSNRVSTLKFEATLGSSDDLIRFNNIEVHTKDVGLLFASRAVGHIVGFHDTDWIGGGDHGGIVVGRPGPLRCLQRPQTQYHANNNVGVAKLLHAAMKQTGPRTPTRK